jgi:general secretion pathway protein D
VTRQPPKINLWIKNLPAEEVLNQVTDLAGLVAYRQDNTVTVMTYEEYCRQFGVEKTVLQLRNAKAKDLAAILKPLVEKEGQSRIIPDERSNQVILLTPKPLLASMEKLVTAMDVPLELALDTIRVIQLKHVEAQTLAPVLEQFLTQNAPRGAAGAWPPALPGAPRAAETPPSHSAATTSQTAPSEEPAGGGKGLEPVVAGGTYSVRFMCEPRLNMIVLRGPANEVLTVSQLITDLDVPGDIETVSYELTYADVREAFEAVRVTLGETGGANAPGRLRVALSELNAKVVVTGSSADHKRVRKIIEAIDKPLPGTGGIRVYRLENATAPEVARVIQELIETGTRAARPTGLAPRQLLGPPVGGIRRVQPPEPQAAAATEAPSPAPVARPSEAAPVGEIPPSAIAAPEINAVIVRASAVQQEELGRLIAELDRPRDQVILEVTLVSVRSTEGFSLGLELAGASINGRGVEQIAFTHFGIGQIDAETGRLRLAEGPLTGLSLAIFDSDDFSLVLNALKSVGDTRITSSPKILVEDNSPAQISQINQEPFEVTDQGQTTTTTSFGGFVDAGTILTVTPHLSQEDWLRLAYEVTFSSFGTRTNTRLPPPRLQNAVTGTVRVPAEHTVVLGGLVNTRKSKAVEGIPLLSDIPLAGELFKNRDNSESKETLFVFIRPIILRRPSFEDLICLSKDDLRQAKLPPCEPMNPVKLFPYQYELNKE